MEPKINIDKTPIRRSALAKKLLIRGENIREFEAFSSKIRAEILIRTEIENILLEKFISCAWKLKRATEVERNLLNNQNNIDEYDGPIRWGSQKKRVRNIKNITLYKEEVQHIIQYQLDLERSMQKYLERLREEQKLN